MHVECPSTLSASQSLDGGGCRFKAALTHTLLRPSFPTSTMGGVKKQNLARRKNAALAVQAHMRSREEKRKRNEEMQLATSNTSTLAGPSPSTSTPSPSTSTPTGQQTPTTTLSSAKKRKLQVCGTSIHVNAVDDENIVLKKSYIQEIFSTVVCSQCYGKVKVGFSNKMLDHAVDLQCEDCGCRLTDSDVKETPITKSLVYA